ncbi:hypothetical protein [Lichenifustis flavocetrariae]|uniref:Uncharacterized protein n=1 Tax=Lichenifustis flavocetrariae TaxID=2949735 RepID=A0AA41YZJ9_9HYPH|nr:hypothetical protein [Lichenifustis flavocetrariae]MCW6506582.1 hypothetical protein [Lichenifustis flavocetrariae]
MFKTLALVGLLLPVTSQAIALAANDTMAEWGEASAADRDALLDALGPTFSQSFKADRPAILNCLNQVGQNAAHAPLPIREVAKACAENAKSPQDTNKSDEI